MSEPKRADIPEGSLVSSEIVITSYFDTDGQMKYATCVSGDPNLAQAVGLCELAKHTIHESYLENEPYPPDTDDDDEEDEDEDE